MASTAGALTPSSSKNRRRGKKSGVPTRDKLSKAIALVQSSKHKLDLSHLEEENYRASPSPSPVAAAKNAAKSKNNNNKSKLGNDFANNLYRAINKESQPSPSSSYSPRHKRQSAKIAAATKFFDRQSQHPPVSNHSRVAEASPPTTPKAFAAAAVRKSRASSPRSPAGTPTTGTGGGAAGTPLTPRAAAAAAISAEKRRSRARKEKLDKLNTGAAVASPAHHHHQPVDNGRRINPTGKYHREKNYKSHQADVDAAMKFSNDIEKDIQATSQTLAKINEFIDNVSTQPQKKKDMSIRSTTKNNSFVQIYQRNVMDATNGQHQQQRSNNAVILDDPTIDSSAAIGQGGGGGGVLESREPESTRATVTAEDTERETSRSSSASGGMWNLDKLGIQEARHRNNREDQSEFDSLGTYASSKQAPASYAVTMEATYDMKFNSKKEKVKANKDTSKASGFDALLNVAAATLSENYMTNYQQETIQVNRDKPSKPRQIPVPLSSDEPSAKEAPIEINHIHVQQMAAHHSPGQNHLSLDPNDQSVMEDPPDGMLLPHAMDNKDELQQKEKENFSFDSLALEGTEDGLDTPHNPNLLSQISAFIDKVEQKNRNGKKKSKKPVVADPMTEALHTETFANDLDIATLANIFDEPLTKRSNRKKEKETQEIQNDVPNDPLKDILMEKLQNNSTSSVGGDTTTLASDSWLELKNLLNNITDHKKFSTADNQVSAGKADNGKGVSDSSGTNNDPGTALEIDSRQSLSKEDDPVCLVRGDAVEDMPRPSQETRNKANLSIDTKADQRERLEPRTGSTPPTNKTAFGLTILASNKSQKARRGADPPDAEDNVAAHRERKDPPAEIVASTEGGLQTNAATPRNRNGVEPILDSSPKKTSQINATPRDGDSRKQMEPSPRNSSEVQVTVTQNSARSSHPPPKPEQPLSASKQVKVLHVDVTGTGTEATPINLESPTAGANAKQDPVVFVDLTEVNSADICKDNNQTKKPPCPNTEMEASAAQEKALKELLALAETPRKPGVKGTHSFEHVLSVDSDEGANLSLTSSGSVEIISDTSTHSKQRSQRKVTKASDNDKQNKMDGKVSSSTTIDPVQSTGEPPGEYSGGGPSDNVEIAEAKDKTVEEAQEDDSGDDDKGEISQTESDRADFLSLVAAHPGQVVSEDDHDPLQSLLFAKKTGIQELETDRKEAGLSLVQLTLDEVKNFVGSNLLDEGGVSNEKIKNLKQLDKRLPSFLNDLGDENYEDHMASMSEEADNRMSQNIIIGGEDNASLNNEQGINVTYNFQPAPANGHVAEQENSRKKADPSLKKKGKKGLKRKFSNEELRPKDQSPNNIKAGPSNWLSSLDHLFSCKQTPSSKANGLDTMVGEASSGETYDIPSDPSSVSSLKLDPPSESAFRSKQVTSEDEHDEESDLDGVNIPVQSNPSDASDEGSDDHQGRRHQELNTGSKADAGTAKKELDESGCTKEELLLKTSPRAKKADGTHPTQVDASEAKTPAERKSTGPPSQPSPKCKTAIAPQVDSEPTTNNDDDDDDCKHFAMAAELLPEGSDDSAPSSKGFAVTNKMVPTPLHDVGSSTDTPSIPDGEESSKKKKPSTNEVLSDNRSAPDPLAKPSTPKKMNKRSTQNEADLLKFAYQSESLAGNEGSVADETSKVQGQVQPTDDNSAVKRSSSPKKPPPKAKQQQSKKINVSPSGKVEGAVSPKPTKGEAANESQAEFMRQASSMLGPATSEPSSPQSLSSPRDSQQKKNSRTKEPNLFKFASQSESLPDCMDEIPPEEVAPTSKSPPLPPRLDSIGDKVADKMLPSQGQVEESGGVEELPDRYSVAQGASSDEGLKEVFSEVSTESLQKKVPPAASTQKTENNSGDRKTPTGSAKQSSGWENFVDLTSLEEDEEAKEKQARNENAWETALDLGSFPEDSSNNASWERLEAERLEAAVSMTPKMHESKRFDLPKLNVGSYGDDNATGGAGETDDVEVDLDVGFVKKALAPVMSEEDEDDDERRNKYISIEASADEDDQHHGHFTTSRLDTISDDENEDEESSYVPSSSSFAERMLSGESGEESLGIESLEIESHGSTPDIGSTPNTPIVVDREVNTLLPMKGTLRRLDSRTGTSSLHGRELPELPEYSVCASVSYESDNDEWLRKRDLATRKTQDPKSWLTRTTSGIQSKLSFVTVETPKAINGVAAAKKLLSRQPKLRGGRRRNPIPSSKCWNLSYKERTKEHAGYFDVDFFSLFDSSAVGALQPHHLDPAPWESRDVRQHFLHEHSIGFSKNWFGKAQRTRGNNRIKERVAHPKSMEMPMENKPHPNEWTEEWYKTWKAPIINSNSRSITSSYSATDSGTIDDRDDFDNATLNDDTSSYAGSHSESHLSDGSSYSSTGSGTVFTDGDDYYEDTPQCGTLINVKPKIGERVSRIHPDYTSQLRRSRWRKKYFPRGTFPYEK